MTLETLTAAAIFSRLMIEPIDQRLQDRVPVGFQSFFGPQNGGREKFVLDSEVMEFDVRKGNRGISTFVHRGIYGEALNKPKHVGEKFTSLARTFPLLHDTGLVTAAQLNKRTFNESPYMPLTQFERAQKNAKQIAEDIINDFIYGMEYSAAQMIKTGKMDLIYNTSSSDEQLDTKRDSDHTFTVTASWATAGTSILDSIDSMATLVIQDSNQTPDFCIAGYSIPGYLAANTEILALAGVRGAGTSGFSLIYFGDNFKPDAKYQRLIDSGFTPICLLLTKMGRRIALFTYEKTYVRSASTTYYMGAKEFILGSTSAMCDRMFGPPEKLDPTDQMVKDWDQLFGYSPESPQMPPNVENPGVLNPLAFSCDVMRAPGNKAYEINVQAAPVYITRDTDAFVYCADVTST